MDRRGFLGGLAGGLAALAYAPRIAVADSYPFGEKSMTDVLRAKLEKAGLSKEPKISEDPNKFEYSEYDKYFAALESLDFATRSGFRAGGSAKTRRARNAARSALSIVIHHRVGTTSNIRSLFFDYDVVVKNEEIQSVFYTIASAADGLVTGGTSRYHHIVEENEKLKASRSLEMDRFAEMVGRYILPRDFKLFLERHPEFVKLYK